MKVFISWSGPPSRELAALLKDWLPKVMQHVTTWMSQEDIPKGKRWFAEIDDALAGAGFGLVCVSPHNLTEPWLNFEAGALAAVVPGGVQEARRVSPVLLGISTADLVGPLEGFNATRLDSEDMHRLVRDINAASTTPVSTEILDDAFQTYWPRLEAKVAGISIEQAVVPEAPSRSESQLLEELVERTRRTEHELTILNKNQGWLRREATRGERSQPRLRDLMRGLVEAGITPLNLEEQGDRAYSPVDELPNPAQIEAIAEAVRSAGFELLSLQASSGPILRIGADGGTSSGDLRRRVRRAES